MNKKMFVENILKNRVCDAEALKLYFQKEQFQDFSDDPYLLKTRDELLQKFDLANNEEKIFLANTIFMLDSLLNRDGLGEYVYRMLPRIYDGGANFRAFIEFMKKYSLPEETLLQSLRKLLKNFFTFSELERRSIFVNALAVVWNTPSLFNSSRWLDLMDDLIVLLDTCIEKELIEEQMYIHFFTYHVYGNNIHTIEQWREFSAKVEKPASRFYQKWGAKHSLKRAKESVSNSGKRKIGFLIDRIVMNSPWMVFYSLVKSLMQDENFKKEFEIYVYSMNYMDKQMDEKLLIGNLKALGIRFFSPYKHFKKEGFYYSHVRKAMILRDRIIDDGIDYLISGFGYDIPNFIFSNRSAPVQIFWSHGNCTSEVLNIDRRISHFEQECKEYDWRTFDVPIVKEFLIGTEDDRRKGLEIKKAFLEQFGTKTVILGTIGRLVKIDSYEYLDFVAKVMGENPNTIYLACGDGNKESVRNKIRTLGIDENRFVFTGQINPHVFGWVIDLWLETFPLRQGQSRNEFEAKAGAIVGYRKFYTDKAIRDIENLAREFDLPSPLAYNMEEYVKISTNLIKNEFLRKKTGELYKQLINKYLKEFDLDRFKEVIGV